MLQNLNALLAPALMDRLVLVVNHVMAAEPQAVARMLPHQGRVLRLDLMQLPRLLPAPPPLAFRVTPAGLVEWCRDPVDADLRVRLDAANPAALALQAFSGQMPPVVIEGDANLAADVDWLLKNLRWDVADDLQRLFGPSVAHELHRLGAGLATALRKAMQGARQGADVVAERMRNR
jgi:ubiquinone biosynthesis protein UbiJ